jgi:Helitron helicase-like domain at N-terminus
MKSFISPLLKFDPKQKDLEGGILGVVKAYYGCVEAQGRGTLHCHMMVWLEGGLNPDEIKKKILDDGDFEFRDRLIAFLDDTISNEIPEDPDPRLIVPSSIHHPCSVRGHGNIGDTSGIDREQARKKDIYHLTKKCQIHKHSKTCYKYWKGPPHPKECRFDLDPSNVQLETTFDMETGEICMRCLDGLVNNFNETILEAIRCNMDIKFIGSGSAAKAIIYYITNYITKLQLKTHVAYSALELSVKKLGEYNAEEDELTVRAKKLLQKCAYSMISHQELSAQQVASYLMDYEDHFTSHEYQNLFWTSFESFINKEDPSPECYHDKNLNKVNSADHKNSSYNNDDNAELDIENGVDNENMGHESENLTDHNDCLEDKEPFEDDEVTISTHTVGKLFAKANQVADYQLRGQDLENWCVWDFISQTEKIRIRQACTVTGSGKRKDLNENFDSDNIQVDDQSDNHGDGDDVSECDDHEDTAVSNNITEFPTQNGRRQRKTIHFQSEHIEALTHCSSIQSLEKNFIPVPIGPSLPRRDQIEVRARYCRLMLILFRPWRHANDLRLLGQSWEAAFSEFLEQCSTKIKNMMNNMQLLHECHDSGRDHFADRRNKGRTNRNRCPQEITNASSHGENDDFGPVNPDIILDHLQSISNCNSQRMARSKETVDDCLLSAEKSGMFDSMVENLNDSNRDTIDNTAKESYETESVQKINDCDLHLEEQWKTEYELRRDQWKRKASTTDASITSSNIGETGFISVNASDGSALRMALQNQTAIEPSILLQNIPQCPTTFNNPVLDIDAMIKEYTLNTEQAQAFRIICEHSLKRDSSPL